MCRLANGFCNLQNVTRESIKEVVVALHGIVLCLQSYRYNDYYDSTDRGGSPCLQCFPRTELSAVRPSPL